MHDIVLNRREASPEDGKLALTIDGKPHFFEIETDEVSAQLLAEIPQRALDLLDIAGTVFATDSSLRRGGLTRSGFGADWRRDLRFRIPVRDPEFWRQAEVTQALTAATEFMTDDAVVLEFERAPPREQLPIFLQFDQSSAFAADEVVMFSGGLDSLAGVVERLATTNAKLALVTHRSAQKRMPHQNFLAKELKERFPGRVLWIPIKARRMVTGAVETTQRSRSLLFAALGYLVSHILGTRQLHFFENGIVSQNLPISPQVIGTMATRTTHPLVIERLGHLLRLVAAESFDLSNPYTWLTKTEVVGRLKEHGAADLIAASVSCSEVHHRTVLQPQCGACSQCIDRRMAILACGMTEHDPADSYETEVLSGAREKEDSRTMALDWTRHAQLLGDMDELTFMERFGNEVAQILEGYPDLPPSQAARRVYELQKRHGEAVQRALRWALQHDAPTIVAGKLPASSLLGMFLGSVSGQPVLGALPDPGERYAIRDQHLTAVERPTTPQSVFPLRLVVEGEKKKTRLTVVGLGQITGMSASIVPPMKPIHDSDVHEGREAKKFRFIQLGDLASALTTSKSSIQQRVRRCREGLAEFYREVEGQSPPDNLLIENRPQKGYRLDPTSRFIESEAAACSGKNTASITRWDLVSASDSICQQEKT